MACGYLCTVSPREPTGEGLCVWSPPAAPQQPTCPPGLVPNTLTCVSSLDASPDPMRNVGRYPPVTNRTRTRQRTLGSHLLSPCRATRGTVHLSALGAWRSSPSDLAILTATRHPGCTLTARQCLLDGRRVSLSAASGGWWRTKGGGQTPETSSEMLPWTMPASFGKKGRGAGQQVGGAVLMRP